MERNLFVGLRVASSVSCMLRRGLYSALVSLDQGLKGFCILKGSIKKRFLYRFCTGLAQLPEGAPRPHPFPPNGPWSGGGRGGGGGWERQTPDHVWVDRFGF